MSIDALQVLLQERQGHEKHCLYDLYKSSENEDAKLHLHFQKICIDHTGSVFRALAFLAEELVMHRCSFKTTSPSDMLLLYQSWIHRQALLLFSIYYEHRFVCPACGDSQKEEYLTLVWGELR